MKFSCDRAKFVSASILVNVQRRGDGYEVLTRQSMCVYYRHSYMIWGSAYLTS